MSNKTTQAICESMGWDNDAVSIFAPGIGCIGLFDDLGKDTPNGNWLVKALQARLVEEGWIVSIEHHVKNWGPDGCNFYAGAIQHEIESDKEYFLWGKSEPEAIVALYCKVKGIKVG